MALDAALGVIAALYDEDGRPRRDAEHLFEPEQAAAVTMRDGPLLLSASAGSGKTTVLAERFVRSVLEDGLAPHELLAITFTDKAAGELRTKIRGRFIALGEREAARDTAEAWISTFHGFCARVLRAHAVQAGLDPAFTVLDDAGARNCVDEAFSAALETFLADAGAPALDLVAAWGVDRLRKAIADVHTQLRSEGATSPRLPAAKIRITLADALSDFAAAHATLVAESASWKSIKTLDEGRAMLAAAAEHLLRGEDAAGEIAALKLSKSSAAAKTDAAEAFRAAVARVGEALADSIAVGDHALLSDLLHRHGDAYAAAKRGRSAVDYDDLELMVRDLFDAAPGVAAAYAERFARIMVDEFQDTNPLQMQLLRHLDRENVFLVGDELQSIYGFRHADIAVFRAERERHAELGRAPELPTNWRSRPAILTTINEAFGGLHGRYVQLLPGREDEPLAAGAPRVELLVTDAAFDDAGVDPALVADLSIGMPAGTTVARMAEARVVARRVKDLIHAGGYRPSEVAILLRSVKTMHVFERALEREGLATLASGGRGYWLRQQVQDLTSYLSSLANPLDEPTLFSLLASPLVGLSADALARVAADAREAHRTVWEWLPQAAPPLDPRDRARLLSFSAWFAEERSLAPRTAIDELIARVVVRTGYDAHVLRLRGGRRRLANVRKLQRLATAYEAVNGRDLRAFADHAAAEAEVEAREPDAPIELGDLEAVRLMTIHAAKGLQFGVVVVADLGRQGNASSPDLVVSGDRVGLRVIRPGREALSGLDFDALCERRAAADDAEERRVMHVAFTRAQERLILSGVAAAGKPWGSVRTAGPPLNWIGAALDADVITTLASDQPVATIDRGGVRCVVSLTAPQAAGPPAIALPPPPEAQLELPIDAAGETGPAVAAVPVPAIAAISFSSMARYAECPYRYYLQRILGLADQEPPPELAADQDEAATGIDALLRGSIAHRLLELSDPGAVGPAEVQQVAEETETELTSEEVEDLVSLAQAFGRSPLAARLGAAARVHREYPFAFGLDDHPDAPLVNGIVDVLAQESDGGLLVVDYKTNRVGDADLREIVEQAYGNQRSIYALAGLLTGASRVDIAYCFLERPAEPIVDTFTAADLEWLFTELRSRAAGMRAGDFPVTGRPHRDLCLTCPGRGGLCSWPQERVLEPLNSAAD